MIVGCIAVYTDTRTRKIPNKLTFPGAFIGLIVNMIWFASQSSSGVLAGIMGGAMNSIAGWFVGVFVMSVIKALLRHMGHGDTKLMAAMGAFVGPRTLCIIILYYCFCYGIYSAFKLARVAPWMQLMMHHEAAKAGLSENMPEMNLEEVNKVRKETHAVAPVILCGAICGILMEIPTLKFMGFIK